MGASVNSKAQIEDLGNHPAQTVVALRSLLAGGASAIADPKRTRLLRSRERLGGLLHPRLAGDRENTASRDLAKRSRFHGRGVLTLNQFGAASPAARFAALTFSSSKICFFSL